VYWFVRRPREQGVRCALWRDGDLLLVRHSYGERGWLLPGGRLKRGEAPSEGARREVRQEVGADLRDWDELGSIFTTRMHKRDTTFFVRARLGEAELRLDAPEFAEVRWWTPGDLPAGASPELVDAQRRGFLAPP
jgi:ADP-ribose pyrophosphatase YjhB (NUDIX family)